MSYQVLARKWRPRNFSEVVGQQHVLEALSNALTHQRLHHAYLLTGTRGVGKTTIARILSRSLNCATGITATPCGECSACVDIEAGRFVDLMEIDAASRTKVEDTREILENVQYRPTSGRYKVYLIDEVHMLSRHSFNALLKTLEEPPPHVIFLLATTDPDKLPITVLSRCLQFHLRALTRNEIETQLAHILNAEQIPYDTAALQLLARSAQGSMRDALSLTDQAIAQGNQAVHESQVAAMLGRIDPHNVLQLLRDILAGEDAQVIEHARRLVDKMADIGALLPELQNALHQLALAHSSADYLDAEFAPHREAIQQLLQAVPSATWSLFYRLVVEGRKEQPFAPDALSGVEMTLLRLLAFRPDIAGAALPQFAQSSGVAEIEKKNSDSSKPVNSVEPAQPTKPAKPNTPPSEIAEDVPAWLDAADSDADEAYDGLDEAEIASLDAQQRDLEADAAQQREAQPPSAPLPKEGYPPSHEGTDLKSLLATREQIAARRRAKPSIGGASTPEQQEKPAATAPPRARHVETQSANIPAESVPEPDAQPSASSPDETERSEPISPTEPTSSDASSATPETRFAREIDGWSARIDDSGLTGMSRQVLLNSVWTSDKGVLLIDESQRMLLNDSMHAAFHTLLADSLAGRELVIEFGTPEQTPAQIQQEIDAQRQKRAEQRASEHPDITLLRKQLDAVISDVRPSDD